MKLKTKAAYALCIGFILVCALIASARAGDQQTQERREGGKKSKGLMSYRESYQRMVELEDRDGDGYLSEEEYIQLESRSGTPSERALRLYRLVYRKLDADGDGRVDAPTFAEYWSKNIAEHQRHMWNALKLDTEDDDRISRQEAEAGRDGPAGLVARTFDRMDRDSDGFVEINGIELRGGIWVHLLDPEGTIDQPQEPETPAEAGEKKKDVP